MSFVGWVKFSGTFTGINSLPGGFYRGEGRPGALLWGQDGAGMNMYLEKQTSKISYLKWMLGISRREGDLVSCIVKKERYSHSKDTMHSGIEDVNNDLSRVLCKGIVAIVGSLSPGRAAV